MGWTPKDFIKSVAGVFSLFDFLQDDAAGMFKWKLKIFQECLWLICQMNFYCIAPRGGGRKMNQAFKTSQATHQARRWLNLPQKSQQLIDGSPLIYQMYISRSSSGGYENEKCAMLSAQLVDLKVEPVWVTSIDLPMQILFSSGGFRSSWQKQDNLIFHSAAFSKSRTLKWQTWSSHNFPETRTFLTDSRWRQMLNRQIKFRHSW